MYDIVLATINARFIHSALGLRYLHANLGELKSRCVIREFENSQSAKEIAEAVVRLSPKILGLGVYIWNVERTREVVSILRKVSPETMIVLGGPEVSYDFNEQPLFKACDYLITGEADLAFARLCSDLLMGQPPKEKVINGGLPDLKSLALPYQLYSDDDIANRVLYVEASRGCPFTCEFCLSSVDVPVRSFDLETLLGELDALFQRGARSFKFVDRTFNLNVRVASRILQFFLDRMSPGLFVHFEMVPDRFPHALRDIVAKFPPGALQLEIGVQSMNPTVGSLISRRQDIGKLCENLTYLRKETSAYLHVDLIVGLPGEGLDSFAHGFDTLVALDPHEIQVGMLKLLRGTPISRHIEEHQMRFREEPPYEILSTRDVGFLEMQRMERFSRYWDLVGNSGNFVKSRGLIWSQNRSPFAGFMEWSDWLYSMIGRRSSVELKTLTSLLFQFLTQACGLDVESVGRSLAEDYQRGGRSDLPQALLDFRLGSPEQRRAPNKAAKRQSRVAHQ